MEEILKQPMNKKVYYVIGAVAIIAVLVLVYVLFKKSATPATNNTPLTDVQKQDMLDQLAKPDIKTLTEQQRLDSLNALSKQSPASNLTPDQKLQLLQSFNK